MNSSNKTIEGGAILPRAHEMRCEADELFRLHGMSADAPHAFESENAYARRLLNVATSFSPDWQGVDISRQSDELLPLAWKKCIADAVAEFKKPVGELREVVYVDESNQKIRKFYGHPEAVRGRFKAQSQFVIEWNNDAARGANSYEARFVPALLDRHTGKAVET